MWIIPARALPQRAINSKEKGVGTKKDYTPDAGRRAGDLPGRGTSGIIGKPQFFIIKLINLHNRRLNNSNQAYGFEWDDSSSLVDV